MFPVAFYGILLASVFGLFFQHYVQTPESWLRTVVSLPLRAYSILWSPSPVYASDTRSPGERTPGERTQADRTEMLRSELLRRLGRTALAGAVPPGMGPPGKGPTYVPRVYAVVDRRRNRVGMVDQLCLWALAEDLVGCHPMVTAGDQLLGFLAPHDPSAPGTAAAVVRLLHYRPRVKSFRGRPGESIRPQATPVPRRVPARIAIPDHRELRCLVEPARSMEDWPLRCVQIERPYLASRLRRSGQPVTTDHVAGDPQGVLPAGLSIGTLKIWGYPARDIPVGLYVQPAKDPEAIATVVLWHPAATAQGVGDLTMMSAAIRGEPVRWMQIPAPSGPRWLVTARSGIRLRPSAALVQDGVLLGTLQDPWSGQSLVLPFDQDPRSWSVLLLPKGAAAVVELTVRVQRRHGRVLTLSVGDPAGLPTGGLEGGYLFTGANGPHCPLGLFLGAVLEDAEGLLLRRPDEGILRPEVYLGPKDLGR